jgi:hypothetical protein
MAGWPAPQIDRVARPGHCRTDEIKRAAVGNKIVPEIWQEAHNVVLYARPGAVTARRTLTDFGVSGFAGPDYINTGFVK